MTAIAGNLRFFRSRFFAQYAAIFISRRWYADAGKMCALLRLFACHKFLLEIAFRSFVMIVEVAQLPHDQVVPVGLKIEKVPRCEKVLR
jgi:hypothetical protein